MQSRPDTDNAAAIETSPFFVRQKTHHHQHSIEGSLLEAQVMTLIDKT